MNFSLVFTNELDELISFLSDRWSDIKTIQPLLEQIREQKGENYIVNNWIKTMEPIFEDVAAKNENAIDKLNDNIVFKLINIKNKIEEIRKNDDEESKKFENILWDKLNILNFLASISNIMPNIKVNMEGLNIGSSNIDGIITLLLEQLTPQFLNLDLDKLNLSNFFNLLPPLKYIIKSSVLNMENSNIKSQLDAQLTSILQLIDLSNQNTSDLLSKNIMSLDEEKLKKQMEKNGNLSIDDFFVGEDDEDDEEEEEDEEDDEE